MYGVHDGDDVFSGELLPVCGLVGVGVGGTGLCAAVNEVSGLGVEVAVDVGDFVVKVVC